MKRTALFISQHYEPEPNFIVTDVAEGLAAKGWRVYVITCFPNYPHGQFYEGHKWYWPKVERLNGVSILRLPHFPDHSLSMVRRAISYLSFAFLSSLVGPFFCIKPNVVWVYQTPFSTAIAALFYKVLYRAKLVFMYADLWPESFIATDTVDDGAIIKVCKAYRRFINYFSDVIIGSTRGTCRIIEQEATRVGEIKYIPVWVSGIPTVLPEIPEITEPTVVYAGNLGRAQCIDTILHAAKIVAQWAPQVNFHIYGSGTEALRLRTLCEELTLNNVIFFGSVSPHEAFAALSNAMAQVVILEATNYFAMTVPSKLFMGFAAGTPILAGLQGEALQIATQSGGAEAFTSSDPQSLAEAVVKVLNTAEIARNKMRQNLRNLYIHAYSKDALLRAHMKIFENLL